MTDVRLSRGELWLLETAVEDYVRVGWLPREKGNDPSQPEWFDDAPVRVFNNGDHGLSREELLETLERLVGLNWIEVRVAGMVVLWDRLVIQRALMPLRFDPVTGDILAEPSDAPTPTYNLTASGGEVWEQFAVPNWESFLELNSAHRPSDSICEGRLRGGYDDWLERYLWSFHYANGEVLWDGVRFEEQRPFEATYWKTLPVGWDVRFQFRPRHADENDHARRETNDLVCWGFNSMTRMWRHWPWGSRQWHFHLLHRSR